MSQKAVFECKQNKSLKQHFLQENLQKRENTTDGQKVFLVESVSERETIRIQK